MFARPSFRRKRATDRRYLFLHRDSWKVLECRGLFFVPEILVIFKKNTRTNSLGIPFGTVRHPLTILIPPVQPKTFSRDELSMCVPLLFACLEDRAADVRKRAGDCVLPFMLHLGYESMHKQMDKLKVFTIVIL